jgi:hypothetical protein
MPIQAETVAQFQLAALPGRIVNHTVVLEAGVRLAGRMVVTQLMVIKILITSLRVVMVMEVAEAAPKMRREARAKAI